MNNNQTTIGERLKQLRQEYHLSQKEVAQICFIARSTYAQYETNAVCPPPAIQKILANFYNVSLDFLNCLSDIKKPNSRKDSAEKYKNIPLLDNKLKPINTIKTLLSKVQRGPYCYIYSRCVFSELRIHKNDLLLLKRIDEPKKLKDGDPVLIYVENNFFLGRALLSEQEALILYNSTFSGGFKKFDNYTLVGIVKEVTFNIK